MKPFLRLAAATLALLAGLPLASVAQSPIRSFQLLGVFSQAVAHGEVVPSPGAVLALDGAGNPVPNEYFIFAVQDGCFTYQLPPIGMLRTDAQGRATLPSVTGHAPVTTVDCRVYVQSRFGEAAADFHVSVYNRSDVEFTYVPSELSVTVNQAFQIRLRARGSQLPSGIRHLPVRFFADTRFGNGAAPIFSPASGVTDANGELLIRATANGQPGLYYIVGDISLNGVGSSGSGNIRVTQTAAVVPPSSVAPQVQDMWWSGPAENGWGMSIVKHGEQLFLAIYGYDAAGAPTWWVVPGGSWDATKKVFTASVYTPHGSPFYAYDASRFVAGAPVGTVTLTFADASHSRLDYTIGAVQGTRQIERISFALPGPAGAPAGLGRDDMYWGGEAQNGWGISVIRQFSELFAVWYTYDMNGAPTWFVMPTGNWVNGSPTYEGRLYRAAGSPWLAPSYDVSKFVATDVGSYRLRFGDGVFEYSVDGRTGSVPLSKVAF